MALITSVVFLALGVKLTIDAEPGALQLFPTMPISLLRFSTLGGSLVDLLSGGGIGSITGNDPTGSTLLHPYAIAGFVGLVSNALQLLPMGGKGLPQ